MPSIGRSHEESTGTIELAQRHGGDVSPMCGGAEHAPGRRYPGEDTYADAECGEQRHAGPVASNNGNAPYQREIMDAIGDQHVRKVVVMSAAQIGKTAMLMELLGSALLPALCW